TGSCRPTPHQSPPSKRRLDRHRSILLIALGTLAAEAGHRVRYTLASKLVNELVEAAEDKQLTKLINHYGRVDLILVDELGYLQLDRRGAELLFQVLTEREERAAIAIASNEPFSSWTKTFTDPRLSAVISILIPEFAV
ncbi:ATP-binding protein, partial [Mycobacterium kansasii]